MPLDLRPIKWDLPAVTVGDSFPATQFQYDGSGTLTRVRMKIKNADGATALTLDSNTSGISITTATDGAWDWTMSEIAPATTAGLTAGFYSYDMEATSSSGVFTLTSGSWELLPQITD